MQYTDDTISKLDDSTLLAIVLTTDSVKYVSVESSGRILQDCSNNLSNLFSKSLKQMTDLPGLKLIDAVRLKATQELSQRKQVTEILSKPKISSSRDVYELFLSLSEKPYEEFWILVLNKASRVLDRFKISEGGVSGTVVDIKRIFHQTLELLGSSLILVHNHPSGNINPSENDITITRKIVEAGKLFDIAVLDHIVVGLGYYSFADNGKV